MKNLKFLITSNETCLIKVDRIADFLGYLDPNESVTITFITVPNSDKGAYKVISDLEVITAAYSEEPELFITNHPNQL